MTRSLLIINPTARGGKAGTAFETLARELECSGPVDAFVTGTKGDAERAARSAVAGNYPRVVVVGGDGTLNEVVNGLAGSTVELGIVALGTANVLARELNLPINDISRAVAVIRGGSTRTIDLGLADSRYFAAMAGIGFDAAVVHRLVPKAKRLIGVGAYGLAIAGELVKHKPAHFRLDVDGRMVDSEAFIVLVANSASYAYGIKVASSASVDDGWLDVMIFEKAEPAKMAFLHQALRVLVRTHLSDPNVRSLRAQRVRVEAEPDVFVQLDGDVVGKTPVQLEVVPRALKVIVSEKDE